LKKKKKSVVFGGFSAEALRSRIEDAECKIVFTTNQVSFFLSFFLSFFHFWKNLN